MHRFVAIVLRMVAFLTLLAAAAVQAESVTFEASFKGKTEILTGDFSFLSNKPFEMTYTFEATTMDGNPGDPQSGFYPGALTGGQFAITGLMGGPLVWMFDVSGLNNAVQVITTPTAHSYNAGADVIGPSVGSATPVFVSVYLVDRDLKAFSSDGLPISIDVTAFEWIRSVQFTFLGANPACCASFGTVESGHIRRVPEPSTLLLLGTGLAGMATNRRLKPRR